MFIPVSLDEFIEIHLEASPNEKPSVLRIRLESAIDAFRTGKKCTCGNEIWVVGAASNDFKCFQCITGKKHPAGEYEIDSVINKIDKFGRRHVDEMDPRKICGLFDDEGYEIKKDQSESHHYALPAGKTSIPGLKMRYYVT